MAPPFRGEPPLRGPTVAIHSAQAIAQFVTAKLNLNRCNDHEEKGRRCAKKWRPCELRCANLRHLYVCVGMIRPQGAVS
jgi:hypothetical protein